MMLYVYAAIVLLVFLVYRDLRAVLACCLPLTVGTFIGYWFMKELEIGLTVATLPVMVLAVGIGVDYAFYIYNRLQLHLRAWPADREGASSTRSSRWARRRSSPPSRWPSAWRPGRSRAQVPGRHGQAAGLHVHGQHGDGDDGAAAFAVWLERLFPAPSAVHAPGILPALGDAMKNVLRLRAGAACRHALLAGRHGGAVAAEGAAHSDPGCRPRGARGARAKLLAAPGPARAGGRSGDHGVVLLSDDEVHAWRQAASRAGGRAAERRQLRRCARGLGGRPLGRRAAHQRRRREPGPSSAVPAGGQAPVRRALLRRREGVAVGLWSLVLATRDGGRTWTHSRACPRRRARRRPT
jgi:hypothetical protein